MSNVKTLYPGLGQQVEFIQAGSKFRGRVYMRIGKTRYKIAVPSKTSEPYHFEVNASDII